MQHHRSAITPRVDPASPMMLNRGRTIYSNNKHGTSGKHAGPSSIFGSSVNDSSSPTLFEMASTPSLDSISNTSKRGQSPANRGKLGVQEMLQSMRLKLLAINTVDVKPTTNATTARRPAFSNVTNLDSRNSHGSLETISTSAPPTELAKATLSIVHAPKPRTTRIQDPVFEAIPFHPSTCERIAALALLSLNPGGSIFDIAHSLAPDDGLSNANDVDKTGERNNSSLSDSGTPPHKIHRRSKRFASAPPSSTGVIGKEDSKPKPKRGVGRKSVLRNVYKGIEHSRVSDLRWGSSH